MADSGPGLRPPADTFAWPGVTVTIVDAPAVLAAARQRPVQLLAPTAFGPPVQRARLSVSAGVHDGQDGYRLTAAVRVGPPTRAAFTVVGRDPIGALLSRRASAGNPVAARLVDGLESAVHSAYRRLGLPAPAVPDVSLVLGRHRRSQIVVDEQTGLRTTVARYAAGDGPGEVTTLDATVPAAVMTSAHLVAFAAALSTAAVTDPTRPDPTGPSGASGSGRSGEGDRRHIVLGIDAAARTGAGVGPEEGRDPGPGPVDDDVTLDQVGGLDGVVAQFREIAVSFANPGAMARWGARRPQGILLFGPPGTGKTMLARALAHEIGGTLREIRTPEILDKWLGASERNMKRIFAEARRYQAPTVLLFDEFDSIVSYAGAGGDSGSQAVNAVAGIFKQEMNNLVAENPNVIVVATTNFPDLIDESLIRSGRFDVHLEIPLPDALGRAQILTRIIRGLIARHERPGFRMFADDIEVRALAELSEGQSGADLAEVVRRAQLDKAMQEARTGGPSGPIGQADLRRHLGQLS